MKTYRALLQRSYCDKPGWADCGWEFFCCDPDEWIELCNQNSNSEFRIRILHKIRESDFKQRKIYTEPIAQFIFC